MSEQGKGLVTRRTLSFVLEEYLERFRDGYTFSKMVVEIRVAGLECLAKVAGSMPRLLESGSRVCM